MKKQAKNRGRGRVAAFTLVELIVSMAIMGLLMVGLSNFFASTFRRLFQAQAEGAAAEREYTFNQIVAEKMAKLESLASPLNPVQPDRLLTFNRDEKNQLPFTFMAATEKDRDGDGVPEKVLGFKDLLPFSKIMVDKGVYVYGDAGKGQLKKAQDGSVVEDWGLKNMGGFARVDADYYVAVPGLNSVKKCNSSCEDLDFADVGGLDSPMDVATDGVGWLYVADSGNNRILRYDLGASKVDRQPLVSGSLSFPTGLAYYETTVMVGGIETLERFLFLSDTFNHKILRLDLSDFKVETVSGGVERSECQGTARFCQLNRPTGLFVFQKEDPLEGKIQELYIADSGNNRLLKMSDPLPPKDLKLEFKAGQNYALDRIELKNDGWSGGTYNETASNLVGKANDYQPETKIFSNPDRLTAFVNGRCPKSNGSIVVNEDLGGMSLKVGAPLKVGGSVYTYGNATTVNCAALPTDPPLIKWRMGFAEPDATAEDGQTLYWALPQDVIFQIDGIRWSKSGFLTTEVRVYDLETGEAESHYQTTRVGSGILGDGEDTIEVVESGDLLFPTGVSNAYGTDTLGKRVVRLSDKVATATFTPWDTNFSPEDFDAVSDFPLDAGAPVRFALYNGGRLLEMTLKTKPDSAGNQRVYKHDAVFP